MKKARPEWFSVRALDFGLAERPAVRPTGLNCVAATGTAIDSVARRLAVAVGHLVHVLPVAVARGEGA